MPSPRKRSRAQPPATRTASKPDALATVTITPLYTGAETHVWVVCDPEGREVVRDLAPSKAEATVRSTAWCNRDCD